MSGSLNIDNNIGSPKQLTRLTINIAEFTFQQVHTISSGRVKQHRKTNLLIALSVNNGKTQEGRFSRNVARFFRFAFFPTRFTHSSFISCQRLFFPRRAALASRKFRLRKHHSPTFLKLTLFEEFARRRENSRSRFFPIQIARQNGKRIGRGFPRQSTFSSRCIARKTQWSMPDRSRWWNHTRSRLRPSNVLLLSSRAKSNKFQRPNSLKYRNSNIFNFNFQLQSR